MLKMGQMCHCSQLCTVMKWDSSGTILWRKFRGLDQAGSPNNGYDTLLYIDGSGNVFTGGSAVQSQDNGCVEKYDPTNLAWYSNRNSLTETAETKTPYYNSVRLLDATDSFIWRQGPSRLMRYDTSGVLQVSSAISHDAWLQGPSGAMFGYTRGASGPISTSSLKRYDTSLAVTHTYLVAPGSPAISGGIYDVLKIDGSRLAIWGWPRRATAPTTCHVVLTDYTFAETGKLATTGSEPIFGRACNAGTNIFAYENGSANRFRKYDCSGADPAISWTNTTMQLTGTGYSPPSDYTVVICTDGTDFYVVCQKASSAFKIQKRSGIDGSITWETDVGTNVSRNIDGLAVGGGVVAAVGLWYNGASNTDPRSVIALDASTGAVLFHKAHATTSVGGSDTGLRQVYVDSSGNVYASGGADSE